MKIKVGDFLPKKNMWERIAECSENEINELNKLVLLLGKLLNA